MLVAQNIKHRYFGSNQELQIASFFVEKGETVVLFGGKESGKTELCKCLSGLETVSGGSVLLDGNLIAEVRPRDRNIVMSFIGESFLEWKTVEKNMMRSDKLRKHDKYDSMAKAEILAEKFMFTGKLYHEMRMLPSYFRAKVALARPFMREEGEYFLFDNPLSNLKIEEREELFSLFCENLSGIKGGIVYATDNLDEVSRLNKRTYVINRGVIIGEGSVEELTHSSLVDVHRMFNKGKFIYFDTNDGELLLATKGVSGNEKIAAVNIEKIKILKTDEVCETFGVELPGIITGFPIIGDKRFCSVLTDSGGVFATWSDGLKTGQMVKIKIASEDITVLDKA